MTELSPVASAVWEAFNQDEAGVFVDYGDKLAAALRVISDFVRMDQPLGDTDADAGVFAAHQAIDGYITAIADELEGTQ
jgi:hypothetical protein